ncbi:hypothetical protein GCM10010440_18030 [Kitasatospora cinereorecta]
MRARYDLRRADPAWSAEGGGAVARKRPWGAFMQVRALRPLPHTLVSPAWR